MKAAPRQPRMAGISLKKIQPTVMDIKSSRYLKGASEAAPARAKARSKKYKIRLLPIPNATKPASSGRVGLRHAWRAGYRTHRRATRVAQNNIQSIGSWVTYFLFNTSRRPKRIAPSRKSPLPSLKVSSLGPRMKTMPTNPSRVATHRGQATCSLSSSLASTSTKRGTLKLIMVAVVMGAVFMPWLQRPMAAKMRRPRSRCRLHRWVMNAFLP